MDLEEELQPIIEKIKTLNKEKISWLGGYIRGLLDTTENNISVKSTATSINILYGSQTGNAKDLAEKLANYLKDKGIAVKIDNMLDYRTSQLKKQKYLFIIVSTQGNGEPPDEATCLYEFLQSNDKLDLANLKYTILALGDSSYPDFCQTGVDFDVMFSKFGAKKIIDRVDCDLDFDDDFLNWQKQVEKYIVDDIFPNIDLGQSINAVSNNNIEKYNKNNPYRANVLTNLLLSDEGSEKQIHHIEIELEDGISYRSGDCLGILSINQAKLVDSLLEKVKIKPEQEIVFNGNKQSIKMALSKSAEIAKLNKKSLQKYFDIIKNKQLKNIANEKFVDIISRYDWLDIFNMYPYKFKDAQQFIDIFSFMVPRLYSISSSLSAHANEVHITVGVEKVVQNQRTYSGVCSNYLANLKAGIDISVYIHKNDHFLLPTDSQAPIIMIGAGTGISPFRSFFVSKRI